MRVVTKLSLAAALLGSLVAFSAGAQASDWDHDHDRHYDRDHRYYEHHDHDRFVERRIVERPVVVERPMFVAPAPVYQAPSGLNLNFNIPLQ